MNYSADSVPTRSRADASLNALNTDWDVRVLADESNEDYSQVEC